MTLSTRTGPTGDARQLAQVADAFGLGTIRRARVAARGGMGEVLRLDTTRGTFALKRLFWEVPQEDSVQREVRFADACRKAGVVSPTSLRTGTGTLLHQPDPQQPAWRVFAWADGVIPSASDADAALWLAEQAGRCHSLAHRDPGDPGVVQDWYLRIDVDWHQLAAQAVGSGATWAPLLVDRLPDFTEFGALTNATPSGDPVTCHRDLKIANMLDSPTSGRCLVDWDNMGPLAPWRELGTVLLYWWDRPDLLRRMLTAYHSHGDPDHPTGTSLFASGLAQWLNFTALQARLLLDPRTPPEHRNFAAAALPPLLTGLPTPGQLEDTARGLGSRR